MERIHNAPYLRAVAAVLFLAACAYLGAGLFGSASGPRTVTVCAGSIRQSVPLTGIALRREALFPCEMPPGITDGERVPAQTALGDAQAVFAPESALCFSGGDGCEDLSPESLQPFSLERVEALLERESETAAGCRLVYDFCWYYAATTAGPCPLDAPARVELSLEGIDGPIPAQLCAVDKSDSSTALLLRAGTMSPDCLCLRRCAGELIIAEYTGLEIPAGAVHSEGGAEFVYVLTAGRTERREVEILCTKDGVSIVSPVGAEALCAGDKVLTD